MFDRFPKVKLSEICSINIGGTPAREVSKFWAESHDGFAWVSIADMKQKYISKTKEYISKTGALSSNVKLIPAGSLLMSFKLTVGKVAINTVELYCNEAIAFFNPLNDSVSLGWLLHVLPLVTANTVTDTAVKGATLNKEKINNLDIPLPEITVQRKIVKVLDTLDLEIEQTKEIIGKLENSKAGLLNDLLTRGVDSHGNLRPSYEDVPDLYQETELGFIPKEWEISLLDDIATRGSGHTPNKNVPSYWNGGIKWVSLADSSKLDQIHISETDKEISTLGIQNSSAVMHSKGTVILSRDAGIGKSAILTEDMAVSQHFMAWKCSKYLNNYFLYYWLQKDKPVFENIAIGSTIKTIGLPFFKTYQIAVPSISEQEKISAILLNADKDLSTEVEKLNKLEKVKIGLLEDLLQN